MEGLQAPPCCVINIPQPWAWGTLTIGHTLFLLGWILHIVSYCAQVQCRMRTARQLLVNLWFFAVQPRFQLKFQGTVAALTSFSSEWGLTEPYSTTSPPFLPWRLTFGREDSCIGWWRQSRRVFISPFCSTNAAQNELGKLKNRPFVANEHCICR